MHGAPYGCVSSVQSGTHCFYVLQLSGTLHGLVRGFIGTLIALSNVSMRLLVDASR